MGFIFTVTIINYDGVLFVFVYEYSDPGSAPSMQGGSEVT